MNKNLTYIFVVLFSVYAVLSSIQLWQQDKQIDCINQKITEIGSQTLTREQKSKIDVILSEIDSVSRQNEPLVKEVEGYRKDMDGWKKSLDALFGPEQEIALEAVER